MTHISTEEAEALGIAQRTKDILKGSHLALVEAINHNLTQPKPHHKNKDLMTATLKLEEKLK